MNLIGHSFPDFALTDSVVICTGQHDSGHGSMPLYLKAHPGSGDES
jgi:hypothetical protein